MGHLKGLLFGVVCCLIATAVWAGQIDSPAGPTEEGSAMYTLEDIYNRLDTGVPGSKRTTFDEPSAGPGSTGHTLDEVMGKAPEKDDANGAGVGDVANGKTFWGLTSGEWGLQTGTGTIATNPAPVPKTGQTTSYRSRDDGELEKGVAWPSPRFTDNGDGTVTDNLTGLMWTKDANLPGGTRNWDDAIDYCNGMNSGAGTYGYSDWRLPNVNELVSLIDWSQYGPVLPSGHPFTSVESSYYWSSTTFAVITVRAWSVGLLSGDVYRDSKSSTYYVWPVRAGQ